MRLWDLYGGLLTATQREITDKYFNFDLTVSEIAEQNGVSRQSVSECLNLCKRQLDEFEEKLGLEKLLAEGDIHLSIILTKVSRWGEEFLKLHPEYAADITNLNAILDKDYTAEIESDLAKINKE